jgi:hypothetical protein
MIAIGLLAGMATAAHGAEQLSVAQLEQKLDASLKRGTEKADNALFVNLGTGTDMLREAAEDNDLARQIDEVELTERLTPGTFDWILKKYQPGVDTERALALLRDRSGFLDAPQAEWPAVAAPDTASQKHILEQARGYVFQTLLRLPNFFATRTTTRYESDPPPRDTFSLPNREGPHPAGSSVLEITFRDGKEFVAPTEQASQQAVPAALGLATLGLATQGEFGPEAAMVLVDLADQSNGTIEFHHWETTSVGTAAVFRYSVAAGGSHYQVKYACEAKTPFEVFPSYRGSIAIVPGTGAILRISLAADSKSGDPITHVTSSIEYGPVRIGDRVYVCPLRSVASMTVEANACGRHKGAKRLAEPEVMMNRTVFSNYHRLGSTITVVPPEKGEKQGPG